MTQQRTKTIAEYIDSAPEAGKPHLIELYRILKGVAPKAEETLKWGTPFFVEPRFLFAFSAHKAHVGFVSSLDVLEAYRTQLKDYQITEKGILKIPYDKPVPSELIQKIARARLKLVNERTDDRFW